MAALPLLLSQSEGLHLPIRPQPQRPPPPRQPKPAVAGPAKLVTCDQTIDPVLRRRYLALKRAIVAGGPADPVAFTKAKHDWIAATLAHLGLADEQPRRLYQDDLDPGNPDRLAS